LVHALAERTERREPRPSNRQENERVLLEAAESIFAEQGFAGATTAAIRKRGGELLAVVKDGSLHDLASASAGLLG
jgi:hypothetical protein